MATLQTYISTLPKIFQDKYSTSGLFVTWMNQLLEELEERCSVSTNIKDVGTIIKKLYWIDKPSDIFLLARIYNAYHNQEYRIEDVNDKFKLLDYELDYDYTEADKVSTFSDPAVDSITADTSAIGDFSEDELENYLFYISAGTLAGNGIVLSGNEASSGDETVLNFLHDRSAALAPAECTEAYLIPPEYYVMLKYYALVDSISSTSDTVAKMDRLVPAWLRWCCERQVMALSNETKYWEGEKDKILNSMQAKASGRVNPSKGRRLIGAENISGDKNHPAYSAEDGFDA